MARRGKAAGRDEHRGEALVQGGSPKTALSKTAPLNEVEYWAQTGGCIVSFALRSELTTCAVPCPEPATRWPGSAYGQKTGFGTLPPFLAGSLNDGFSQELPFGRLFLRCRRLGCERNGGFLSTTLQRTWPKPLTLPLRTFLTGA